MMADGRKKRGSRAGAALALAALCGACGAGEPSGPKKDVRVVLITLDTLRMDSFAGAEGVESLMPRTLERAKQGLQFTRHYAASSTTMPTHASMFTGLHPWEHGVTANGMLFPRRHETVAERFKAAGFRTAAVVASFPLHGKFGAEQGFDVYHNEFGDVDVSGQTQVKREGDFHSRAPRINAKVHEVLDEHSEGDQFLWFHYFDAHAPYGDCDNPESNWFPRVLVQRLQSHPEEKPKIMSLGREYYDFDVTFMDRKIQTVFDRLEAESDRFETHVVVVSDHGEAFGEGGALGHGKRLIDVQIRVPLFILSPRVEPGYVDAPVGSVDVAPTLLSLGGLPADTRHGRDLTRAVEPTELVMGMRRTFDEPETEFRIDGSTHDLPEYLFYVVDDDRMLVGNRQRITRGDTARILRIEDQAERLKELFAGFEDDVGALEQEVVDDQETLDALKKLGYIDEDH